MFDEMKNLSKNSFDAGRWWVLKDASLTFYKKPRYKRLESGMVRNLETNELLTLDDAIDEFVKELR